jgi:hypothetical protein
MAFKNNDPNGNSAKKAMKTAFSDWGKFFYSSRRILQNRDMDQFGVNLHIAT